MTKFKYNTEIIIEKFKKLHKIQYDYSLVDYKGMEKKVKIICPICHKIFEQTPVKHFHQNCPCQRAVNKFTKEKFVKKAKKVHGDKYDYSEVVYINQNEKVKIYCKKCNKYFYQMASSHLRGTGCPTCSHKARGKKSVLSNATCLTKLENKFPNMFIYEMPEDHTNHKCKITCKKCGKTFERYYSTHLRSNGCPFCNDVKITWEEFLTRARKIHGKNYEYDKENFENRKGDKIRIYCKRCKRWFIQNFHSHLNDKGCPKCCESKGERAISLFLEEHNIKYEAQKRFNDCKDKKPLPFDFYLPDYNICIEYQGQQHYMPIERFGGFNEYINRLRKDNIKRNYCNSKKIILICISYLIKDPIDYLEKILKNSFTNKK